eukprot:g1365.t1
MDVSYTDGLVGWTPPVQVLGQRDLRHELDASRNYTELYHRGISIRFDSRGRVRQFDWALLMNSLVQLAVLVPLATTIVVNIAIYLHPKSSIYQPAVKQRFHYEREMSKFAARAALATAQFAAWDDDGNGSLEAAEMARLFEPMFGAEKAAMFAGQIFLMAGGGDGGEGDGDERDGEGGGSDNNGDGTPDWMRETPKSKSKSKSKSKAASRAGSWRKQRKGQHKQPELSCAELIELMGDDLCNFATFNKHVDKRFNKLGLGLGPGSGLSRVAGEMGEQERKEIGASAAGSEAKVAPASRAPVRLSEQGALEKALDERFAAVSFFPAEYFQLTPELRMAYIDQGPSDAKETMFLLHGEPTWSYLYRKMIPGLVDAGYRVVAPDLIGFGRSDKPADMAEYTYAKQVEWVTTLVKHLDLQQTTFFGQDWGGLIGLRVVAENEGRFARVVIGNTLLPVPTEKTSMPGIKAQQPFPAGHPFDWKALCQDGTEHLVKEKVLHGLVFPVWRAFSQESNPLDISGVVQAIATTELTTEEKAAYDAPFPTEEYKAGARKMPLCVPITADDPAVEANKAAWEVLERWQKPFLTTWGMKDPLLGAAMYDTTVKRMIERVPGAAGMPHAKLPNACHFIQEDAGAEIVTHITSLVAATPTTKGMTRPRL